MSDAEHAYGMGWLRDQPDIRDYTLDTTEVTDMLAAAGVHPAGRSGKAAGRKTATLPASVDLRQWCTPIEDQGALGSCTANAAVGLVEYYANRAKGRYVDLSRLFVYKVTRESMGWTGDTGAYLRSAMGALATFGAPPEKFWPYVIANYELEPTPFAYAYAANFKAVTYYRLDPAGSTPADVLNRIKQQLSVGLASMFGFTVYSSYSTSGANGGKFPYPAPNEAVAGGHAVVAVGYDDSLVVKHPTTGATTTGALRIRNSWGTGWGEAGYGWIPYEYVLQGQAVDFWVVVKADWLNTGSFAP